MYKYIRKSAIFLSVFTLVMIGTSTVLALPSQATSYGPPSTSHGNSSTSSGQVSTASSSNAGGSSTANQAQSSSTTKGNSSVGQAHMAAGLLKACQNRQAAITNIMSRIDTRAQNQIALFSTIATRVENFYVSQGKTFNNYNQLVAAVNQAAIKANTDFATVKTDSTFSCTSPNPKGMITSFQSYLKLEISDLQNYRLAVKNLIVGVASANGVNVSTSSQSTSQGGN